MVCPLKQCVQQNDEGTAEECKKNSGHADNQITRCRHQQHLTV